MKKAGRLIMDKIGDYVDEAREIHYSIYGKDPDTIEQKMEAIKDIIEIAKMMQKEELNA